MTNYEYYKKQVIKYIFGGDSCSYYDIEDFKAETGYTGDPNWFNEEVVFEMTQFQYDYLKTALAYGYEWLVREEGESGLQMYQLKPVKFEDGWLSADDTYGFEIFMTDAYEFVTTRDTEPTKIQDILKNCRIIIKGGTK